MSQHKIMKDKLSYVVLFALGIFLVSFKVIRDTPAQHIFRNAPQPIRKAPTVEQGNISISSSKVETAPHVFTIIPYTRGFDGYSFKTCEYSNCVLTENKRENFNSSDAILFYLRYFNKLPTPRPPHQKWIAVTRESPIHCRIKPAWNDIFNATGTYSKRSDILYPYYWFEPGSTPTNHSTRASSAKTKMAAWMVSNCKSTSRREAYVRQLQKYIQVDVHGKCGKFDCPKGGKGFGPTDPCLDAIERDYRFYLSFENSFCESYISEKPYKILDHDIVPVVLGGGDYKEMLPPNSYIDVANFSSPRLLAEYLHRVANDDALYDSYFAWKNSFKLVGGSGQVAACTLCEFLNRSYNKTTTISFRDFFDGNKYCTKYSDYYSSFLNMSHPDNAWLKSVH